MAIRVRIVVVPRHKEMTELIDYSCDAYSNVFLQLSCNTIESLRFYQSHIAVLEYARAHIRKTLW
jgi:hypothetical protein